MSRSAGLLLRLAALGPCVPLLVAQGPSVFALAASGEERLVSADRTAVVAADALRDLGKQLGWRVDFSTKRLEGDLTTVSLDLSFDELNPRTVAQLIAASGNADIVFDDRVNRLGPKTIMHVVPAASPETESGRQRLRRRSIEWYNTFLSDELSLDKLVEEKSMEVRMHLGHLLLEQGELETAIAVFQQVHEEDDKHDYVPMAMSLIAQSHYDLDHFDEAEKWAREVSRMHPSRPETAAATVLLGKTLIALQRYDECVATMRASVLPLANTPEIVDILLITAEAQVHRERPDYAVDQMRMLAESHSFRDLSESQWLDYHYLRGLGAEGTGSHAEAMETLEIFLATGPADPRRGQAFVLLGRAYLGLGKYVEARASASQALDHKSQMDRRWRKEARILHARTALALGQKDEAFADLEREVRKDPVETPELILFLVEAFLEDARYQKAIAAAELLTKQPGKWGDQARYFKILAMWRQNPRAEILDSFLLRALQLAPQIEDDGLQRKAAEIIGQAYGLRGDWERAVNAYRGVLQ